MSFGYGVGDFLAVTKFAWTVYNVYKDAPDEFMDISDEIKSLHTIVKQQHRIFQHRKLESEQEKELGGILQGCENVLKDLDELMRKYQGLGAPQGPRTIDRLKWDPQDVATLRARLTSNTTLLNTFLSSCQHDESQRSMAAIQDLLRHIPRRNSIASIRSFASFATTGSAKGIWTQFCRDLHSAGITADVLRSRKDELVRVLAETSTFSVSLEEVISDTAGGEQSPSPATRGEKNSKIATRNWGPMNRIFRSLLHAAVARGDVDAVETWLRAVGDSNYKLRGVTGLYSAASNGHLEVVKLLLEKGANIEATKDDGRTALYSAASNDHLEVVKLLLEKGTNIEATGSDLGTALHSAAWNGHLEVVKLLLEKGAKIEATNRHGMTVLYFAASNGHLEVVKLLPEKGANIGAKGYRGGDSTSLCSIKWPFRGSLATTREGREHSSWR